MLAIVGFVGCVVKEERRLCKTAVNQALLITMKDYVNDGSQVTFLLNSRHDDSF